MVNLLELPDELICQVLSKLAANKDSKGRLSNLATGHHDIVGFACTCQRALTLCGQFLYEAVLLRKAKEVTTLSHFYRSVQSDRLHTYHARGQHLRDLAVVPDPHHGQESNEEFLKLWDVISSMPAGQLARLHVELPYLQSYDSQFWFRFRRDFGKTKHGHVSRFFTLPWASRLEHCHLNFQQDHGHSTTVSDVISVFSTPRLKSLVLVGLEFSFDVFDWLQVYADGLTKRGSPVERLSLHLCHVPPKAWEVLLSMPRSLRYLSYIIDGSGRRWADYVDTQTRLWENCFGMCEHLAQQKDSLAQLDLDLGGLSDVEVYEMQHSRFRLAHLTSLTDLTIRKRFPDEPENGRMLFDRFPPSLRRLSICDSPYATDGETMVVAAQYYLRKDLSTDTGFQEPGIESVPNEQCMQKSKMLPNLEELSISFIDHQNPGTIAERHRRYFEYIGDRYKRELGWRFVVNRITEKHGALPPCLWDDDVVEFVNVYDNMAEKELWDSKSDYEVEEDQERKRDAESVRLERAAQEER